MVRAVNLAMAIGTAAVEKKDRGWRAWGARMFRSDVTLSAEPRIGNFEQAVVYRAMRLVAIAAIFYNRRMSPKKRAASFGVTGIAIFVDAALF